jgi:hypothetical protein
MGLLNSILSKLGLQKPAAPAAPAATPKPPATATPYTPGHMGTYGGPPAPATPATPPPAQPSTPAAPYIPGGNYPPPATTSASASKPAEMAMVDVMSHLEYLAKTSPIQGLNWKQSINDLMVLLGLPHSPDDIKSLAIELGCPEKEMADSYSRNVWTYQALMKKIAENGGNVPLELLK